VFSPVVQWPSDSFIKPGRASLILQSGGFVSPRGDMAAVAAVSVGAVLIRRDGRDGPGRRLCSRSPPLGAGWRAGGG
jgi:hypothetical protein